MRKGEARKGATISARPQRVLAPAGFLPSPAEKNKVKVLRKLVGEMGKNQMGGLLHYRI